MTTTITDQAETVDNVDLVLYFKLDGARYKRRLVARPIRDMELEINVESRVGRKLEKMPVGGKAWVEVLGGEPMLLTLLAVGDGALDRSPEHGETAESER